VNNLLRVAARMTVLIFAALALQMPVRSAITPSQLDINLGPFPIDAYLQANNFCSPNCSSPPGITPEYNQYYIPSTCPATSTIQACIKSWFTGTGGYISQGVIGVRLYFPLAGGNWSTAWDGNGNVTNPPQAAPCNPANLCWLANFGQLMKDLKSYGIQRVEPNIILGELWAAPGSGSLAPITSGVTSTCAPNPELVFLKWLPFALTTQSGNPPECQDNPYAYANGSGNSYFWGWSPYFNAVQGILQQIKTAGLQIDDFEVYGEINVSDFPLEARMIWDNKHGSKNCSTGPAQCTDVLSDLRYYFSQNGFNPGAVEYSVPVFNPTAAAADCNSVYGADSAMLERESALLGAIAGPYGLFGPVSGITVTNGLPCGGNTSMMSSLPVTYLLDQPAATDIHAEMCVAQSTQGPCNTSVDGTSTSKQFFSDIWTLLSNHSLTANYVIFGETFPNQPGTIPDGDLTQEGASQEAAGYGMSTLYTNHAANVTFRPFENNAYNSPYYSQIPALVNPPF
jgi:hypothetical protein